MKKYLTDIIRIWLVLLPVTLSASALGDAAALMKPKTFRPLTTQGLTSDLYRVGANIECIYPFANDAAWDPKTERYMFIGAPHQIPWVWGFVVYDAATNNWRKGNQDPYFNPSNCNGTGGICTHTYDNITMNFNDGFMYFWPSGNPLLKYNPASDQWSQVPASNTGALAGPYSATNYFPELGGLVYVNAGTIALYEFSKAAWRSLPGKTMGGIHNLGEYSPVHKVMMLGGGAGSRQMYLLDSLENFKTLKAAPWDIEVAQCLLTCDPVSGDFLILRPDSLYAYDLAADAWKGVVKNPIANFSAHYAVVSPVSTHGVIAFLTNYSWPFLLYKHADASPVETPSSNRGNGLLTVFPNPARRGATLNISVPGRGHPADLSVHDLCGRTVMRASGASMEWNTGNLAAGLYLFKTARGTRHFTQRILLQ